MTLACEWINYGSNGQYVGYLARPDKVKGTLPAIIVIQEIWGVDDHIEDVTRRFAQAGYVAFAPDLYAVNGARPEALAADRVQQVKQFLETVPPSVWNNQADRDAALDALPEPQRTQVETTFGTLFGGISVDKIAIKCSAPSTTSNPNVRIPKVRRLVPSDLHGGNAVWVARDAGTNPRGCRYLLWESAGSFGYRQYYLPHDGLLRFLGSAHQRCRPGIRRRHEEPRESVHYQIYDDAHHAASQRHPSLVSPWCCARCVRSHPRVFQRVLS